MSLVDVLNDCSYDLTKFKEKMQFDDLAEDAVARIQVISKYGSISNQIKHMEDMELIIRWGDEVDLTRMVEYQYGFVKEHRSVYVWECMKADKRNGIACYRLASIFRFTPKSKLMMLVKMLGEASVTREVFENALEDRKVKRYTSQYPVSSLSFELVNREYSFCFSVTNINVMQSDINKIRSAWAIGDYKIGFDVECKPDDINIRISATRGNQLKCSHDITDQWLKVEKMLEKQELPDDMVEIIIDEIQKWRDEK